MQPVYFEDFDVGDSWEFGSYDVTREEIVEFAEKYDPQPFHTEPETASESVYGGLIASGWHTTAMFMRMFVEEFLSGTAAMGSPGVDELRWQTPVRPGDTLSVRLEVAGRDATHRERGTVDFDTEILNDEDEPVMTMIGHVMFERRDGT